MASAANGGRRRIFGLFRRQPAGAPTKRAGSRRADVTIAALGVTLGLICALFPWYIFFNPDQFGIRAMRFSGPGEQQAPQALAGAPDRLGRPMHPDSFAPTELDLFATGTTAPKAEADAPSPEVAEQPFPAPVIEYRVVHISSGRAMMEDDSGLFLVQPGSKLPDNATVTGIRQKDGRWVVTTSDDRELEMPR